MGHDYATLYPIRTRARSCITAFLVPSTHPTTSWMLTSISAPSKACLIKRSGTNSPEPAATGRVSRSNSPIIFKGTRLICSTNGWLAAKTWMSFLVMFHFCPQKFCYGRFLFSWYHHPSNITVYCLLVSYRLELKIQRSVETSNSFHTGREGMKAREIHQKYPAEKAKRLIELLRNKQLWYWDDDFPDDEEEHQFTFWIKPSPSPLLFQYLLDLFSNTLFGKTLFGKTLWEKTVNV